MEKLLIKSLIVSSAIAAIAFAMFATGHAPHEDTGPNPAQLTKATDEIAGHLPSVDAASAESWVPGSAASYQLSSLISIHSPDGSDTVGISGVVTALVLPPTRGHHRLATVLTRPVFKGMPAPNAGPTPLILVFGGRGELLDTLSAADADPEDVKKMAGLFAIQVVNPPEPAATRWEFEETDLNGPWHSTYHRDGTVFRKTRQPAQKILVVQDSEASATPGTFWVRDFDSHETWKLGEIRIEPQVSLHVLPAIDAEGIAILRGLDDATFASFHITGAEPKPEWHEPEPIPTTIPGWAKMLTLRESGGAAKLGRLRLHLQEYLRQHPEALEELLDAILEGSISPLVSSHLVTALEEAGAVQQIFSILELENPPRDAFLQALAAVKATTRDPERLLNVVDQVFSDTDYTADAERWSAALSAFSELARTSEHGRKVFGQTLDAALSQTEDPAVIRELLAAAARGEAFTDKVRETAREVFDSTDVQSRGAAVPILARDPDPAYIQAALRDPEYDVAREAVDAIASQEDRSKATADLDAIGRDPMISSRIKMLASEMLARLLARSNSQ